jgi:hypothetical protein
MAKFDLQDPLSGEDMQRQLRKFQFRLGAGKLFDGLDDATYLGQSQTQKAMRKISERLHTGS